MKHQNLNNFIQEEGEDGNIPRYRLPLYAKILYAGAALSIPIYIAALISEPFADFFSRYPGAAVRAVTAYITNWIPFSFAEFLLILSPVILFFLIRHAAKKYSNSWHNTFVYIGSLLSIISIFLSLFVLGFGTAYHGTTLDEKLGVDRRDVSAEELYDTATILVEKINDASEELTFRYQNFSVMPYDIPTMNDKLLEAYDKVCDEYQFIQRLNSRVKPVMLSEAMSYTHITGVYTYFTGEANINIAFPDYTIPFTAAHELAHQRGIAREDEANFVAFLVCTASDDPYIRYSGYINLYEYVASALWSASPERYREVYATLPNRVKAEMSAYSDFFDQYRDSVAGDVSEAVNDTFLTIHGTEGTKSYGMVVDLAVAYYKTK